MNMTITEALAEIKTVNKRIISKREFIKSYLYRIDSLRDPHEKDGGSSSVISKEMQAIKDLEDRIVALRKGIQTANENNNITIEGDTRSIADWIVWRREVSARKERFLVDMRQTLINARDAMRKQGINYGNNPVPEKPADLIVNINEQELNKEHEKLQNILGTLDGQLSLKNATVLIA